MMSGNRINLIGALGAGLAAWLLEPLLEVSAFAEGMFPGLIAAGVGDDGQGEYSRIALAFCAGVLALMLLVYRSKKRRLQRIIQRAKRDWEQTFDVIGDAITVHDRNFNIVRANRAAVELLGVSFDKILNQKCYLSYHGRECPPQDCPSCKALITGEPTTSEIFEGNLQKYLEVKALPRLNENNEVIGLVHIVRDVTRRRMAEDELRRMSLTDELTKLYNRRGFKTVAEQQIRMARRMNRTLTVFYFDLDGLKTINDTFGHQQGCEALVDFSRLLEETFRESDIIARMGGDEFVVLSMDGNDRMGWIRVQRFYRNLQRYNASSACGYRLMASVGVASSDPGNTATLDDLVDRADALMYEQKRGKKALAEVREGAAGPA